MPTKPVARNAYHPRSAAPRLSSAMQFIFEEVYGILRRAVCPAAWKRSGFPENHFVSPFALHLGWREAGLSNGIAVRAVR